MQVRQDRDEHRSEESTHGNKLGLLQGQFAESKHLLSQNTDVCRLTDWRRVVGFCLLITLQQSDLIGALQADCRFTTPVLPPPARWLGEREGEREGEKNKTNCATQHQRCWAQYLYVEMHRFQCSQPIPIFLRV